MKYKHFLSIITFIIISIFVSACKVAEKEPISDTTEKFVDTGALVIESSPSFAQVYVGEEHRGDTPLNLYNLPVGNYDITIKKEGYADFKKTVNIKVGRTEEVDAILTPIVQETKKAEEPAKEMEKPQETTQLNKINLSSFAMYFDFDKMKFTEIRTDGSDLFSRKYETYVHFTTLIPTKINVLNKPISEVGKEDCIFADTAVTQLFSGQTLCVKTGAGNVVAIGGTWQEMPAELQLVQLS